MSYPLGKNTQVDFVGGLFLVRDTSSNDTPMSLDPGTAVPAADANVIALVDPEKFVRGIYTGGARTMGFRFWGSANGGTVVITLKSFMKRGPDRQKHTTTLTASKGNTLLVGTGTFSGSSTANTHPVTGVVVAATTFYELSAITASYEQDPRVQYYPTAGSGASRELYVTVDCLGADILIPEFTSISNSARVVCGAWPID